MAENSFQKYAAGGALRPDSFTGMQPDFSSALQAMFAGAPADIAPQLQVYSGYRSPERQAALYRQALAKYGSPEAARKWVAPPGRSNHNKGTAADLKFLSPAAREWVHGNAGQYGLAFPLANENWHVELAGARGAKAGAPATGQRTASTLPTPSAPRTASAAMMSPEPLANQFTPQGPAPAVLGDIAGQTPVRTVPVEIGPTFGDLLAGQMQVRRRYQEEQDRREAADRERRAALFGVYG